MLEATYCILIFLTLAVTNKIQIYIHISKWCDQRKTVMKDRKRKINYSKANINESNLPKNWTTKAQRQQWLG